MNILKIKKIAFCFLLSAFCFHGFAQSKFGHVDYGEIMKSMPGIDSIQNVIVNYNADLQSIGEQMVREFQEKQAAFEQLANTPGTSPAILKIRQEELQSMIKRIQEFAQSMEMDVQDKQLELLEPFQTKLIDAIKKVAKANHYSYVFDISTLLFSSPSDDLTNKVKAELGIK
ncbi:MAG: OmpH family outer membrane protein [Bacteroidetes bacterium]|nr:OmpH family outer membrane protein [Bacteroidota bacterium]MCL2302022.1 OmpH family outer membrane protein [Lentimicrobiaceae bacterium]